VEVVLALVVVVLAVLLVIVVAAAAAVVVVVVVVKLEQFLYRPGQALRFDTPRFQDSRHKKVARLSALRTGLLCPPGNTPGIHFW